MPRSVPHAGGGPIIRFMKMGKGSWRRRNEGRLVKDIKINPAIQKLLQEPTWSVASLMPPVQRNPRNVHGTPANIASSEEKDEITREKLHHLLKLSALPPPKDQAEEEDMLSTLRSQVHFVKKIQSVDTTDVEPLVAIRDETYEAVWESTVTEEKLEQYFALEDRVGENGTIRRRKDTSMVISPDPDAVPMEPEEKDTLEEPFLLSTQDPEAGRKMGNYFYVKKENNTSAKKKKDGVRRPV